MSLQVRTTDAGPELHDDGVGVVCQDLDAVNRFLGHLTVRAYSPATVRAYAFDLLNFLRFCLCRGLTLDRVSPGDLFDYLDWQARPGESSGAVVVRLADRRRTAPATMNRRIAAVRGLFTYLAIIGARADSPVPAARRSSRLRATRRGLLGHLGPGRPRGGGRLVRSPRRLPEVIDPGEVSAFLADLSSYRDRAIVLAMLLAGCAPARSADCCWPTSTWGCAGFGSWARVVGNGWCRWTRPSSPSCAYLREERPAGCRTAECFVVLRGPTTGMALTEAGMRSVFRTHRQSSGAVRVRPHRLRHTYGSDLAAAGMDLLVLRELMGHASPETTAGYVHLSAQTLATEYAAARKVSTS